MISDDIARLLWREQEGSLSPQERRELEAVLLDRPELRVERERVAELAAKLAAVEAVEPPAELDSLIDDWTAEVAARARREQRRTAGSARPGLRGRRLWAQRFAWATAGAAAALLTVAVLTTDFGIRGFDEQDVYGTLTGSNQEQRFEAEGVALRVSRSGDLLEVEIDGAAGNERFDVLGDGLELASFELLEGSLAEIVREESILQVVSREDSAYDLAFRIGDDVGTVTLRVLRGDDVLITREIRLGGDAGRGP